MDEQVTADAAGTETATQAAIQDRLPLDLDAPIPFELTARARRLVAPASLPPLEVVASVGSETADTGLEALEDPTDTRAARARALRRAGMSIDGIAVELGLDTFVVSAIVDDVAPVTSARRRLRAVDGGRTAAPRTVEDAARSERARQHFERARDTARDEVGDRLGTDDGFSTGLGLVVGAAHLDAHAVLVTVRDVELAAAISSWLRLHLLDDVGRLRAILRVAPQVPGDVARHRWSRALALPLERVTTTRWRTAPTADAVEATLRVADPEVAGRLAGWRDALVATFVEAPGR